ncbi:MAG: N-acetylmuramoyl-L-alanine amidase [Zetaproteobacteria bacterium]|nr:MAG: N-acetylmuramoyl-L-alanine amidase [Zetaproteobacteria bacterium]
MRLLYVFTWLLIVAWSASAQAKTVEIKDLRLWTAPDHSRLVLDLSGAVNYHVFRLHQPERVVLDVEHARLRARIGKLKLPDPVIRRIRSGVPAAGQLRLVIDVKEQVRPRTFLLKPMHGKPYRLVLDLLRPEVERQAAIAASNKKRSRDIVVAVDAGHGGEDPGAIGPHGLKEKTVTLAVAKKLARLIDRQPGMHAVLIRKGDYFVPLKKRVRLARAAHADMMISIHADSVRARHVRGCSVYTLSERGATVDKAARALAAKENAADAVAGVALEDEVDDPVVSRILGDMFRRDALNSSQILAEKMLDRLRRVGPVKYAHPKRARFVVLGALEIPSVLVELDYISNPVRERKLRSPRHQAKLASALFDASRAFFAQMGRLGAQRAEADVRGGVL